MVTKKRLVWIGLLNNCPQMQHDFVRSSVLVTVTLCSCPSSENLFIDIADRLAEDGWRELGYVYVNIDDCWSLRDRDQQGRLQADPKRYTKKQNKEHVSL